MPDPSAALLSHLRAVGAASSVALQAAVGASQPTISRALKPLLQRGDVMRVGRGRVPVYVLPRRVDAVGPTPAIAIVKIDADGTPTPFGTLVPVVGGQDRFWVEEVAGAQALHEGLPWFLADMRPQGFLGRGFAQAHAALGLGANPAQWSDSDMLRALCLVGDDLPGNLVIGQGSFERYQSPARADAVEADYPRLAELALQGSTPGSSAGGEQPKFCTRIGGRDVLVKFSPAGDSETDLRWRDLLVCEHLALRTLADAGVPAAESRVVADAGRVFLEVGRFDRTPRGRVGMVSLLSYDSEYVGRMDNWANTAERMVRQRLLTPADGDRLRLLEAFGRLIGNTDRHYGNVSLLIGPGGDWELAPAYDMLPMIHAPTAGEIVPRDFVAGQLRADMQTVQQWPQARAMALAFWHVVAQDARISRGFRAAASAQAHSLQGEASERPRPGTRA